MTLNQIIDHVGVEPYYREENGIIYNNDCLDILPKMPEKCVDAFLTDPPWGIEGSSGTIGKKRARSCYDTNLFLDNESYVKSNCVPAIRELIRICNCGAVTPGGGYYYHYPRPETLGAFYQPAAVGLTKWGYANINPILFYGRDPRLGKTIRPTADTLVEPPPILDHPCPKPLQAWAWLLDKVTEWGHIVIDAYAGSGTTGVVAKKLGRPFICIEIEEKYCKIAVQRLAQEILI